MRRRWWIGAGVVVALMALVGGLFGYLRFRFGQIHQVNVPGLARSKVMAPVNILLVGNNSRCVLNGSQKSSFGSCSQVGGGRSDVTMVLHLDPSRHTASILSLPRDLWLPIPGTHRAIRVDDALNVGPGRLVKTVEADLGIKINHYVELNFDSFQQVVNALGGINMYFPAPVTDAYSGLNVRSTGCRHLNGFQALQVVRARHMYYYQGGSWHYDGLGDLSRIQRDHEFLRVLATEVLRQGFANPLKANAILGVIAPKLQVDSTFTLSTMLNLVTSYRNMNPASIPTATLPIRFANNFVYQGAAYGDVVMPIEPEDQRALNAYLHAGVAMSQLPTASSISVRVVNGSGLYMQASQTASALSALGFRISGVGDTTIASTPAEAIIWYSPGNQPAAERLLADLGGEVTMGLAPPGSPPLTLITGTHMSVAGAQAATRHRVATPASPVAPVMPARTALPSYDPTSCPAGVTASPMP